MRVQDGDDGRFRGIVEEQRSKTAFAQVPGDLPQRLQDDALAHQRPFGEDVAFVGIEAAGHRQRDRPVGRAQGPAILLRAGEAQQQALVLQQLLGRAGCAVGLQIGRCGAQEPRAVGDLADDEARVRQGRHADGSVELIRQEIEDVVGEAQAHLDLRMAGAEGGDQRGQDPPAEAERCRDPQVAARHAAGVADRGLGLLDRLEDIVAGSVEGVPLLGRLHLPRGAVQEPGAEMALELLQPVADHGRRHAQVPPGSRQAAQLHHPHEHPDVLDQRHRRPPVGLRVPAVPCAYTLPDGQR